MKESVTKFDLEAAFKALDDIEVPVAEQGIKANRPALTEIFSRKSKFESLFEEYYDIDSTEDLGEAKEAREAEVAKAKLARIEKIVDLDAESPEDLLTSYVGKYIVQCPQCMTLFYKDKEDVVESEDDPTTVNVSEVCQHCGNEAGYTLIGKVDEAAPEEVENFEAAAEEPAAAEEVPAEETTEDATEESDDADDLDLDILDLEDEAAEEDEKTEESFSEEHEGELLVEELREEADLEVSADEFEKLISSPEFNDPISDSEARAMLNSEKETETEADLDESKETLEEGIFDKLKNIFTKKLKTREDIANFVLTKAMINGDEIELDKNGDIVVQNDNRKYDKFLLIGYAPKMQGARLNEPGKTFTVAATKDELSSGKLIIVKRGEKPAVVTSTDYAALVQTATGWSSNSEFGPVCIYLIKGDKIDKATFVCQYFDGKLDKSTDQLETLKKVLLKDIESAKISSASSANLSDVTKLKASEVKAGMTIRLENKTRAEVTQTEQSKLSTGMVKLSVKLASDDTGNAEVEIMNVPADFELTVFKDSLGATETATVESLDTIMSDLDSLQESSLEAQITQSLAKTYGNVETFKITECSYLNEMLSVEGEIQFKTGATEKTTFTFTEATVTETGKVSLKGTNTRFGSQKFIAEGFVEKTDRTFITESFE